MAGEARNRAQVIRGIKAFPNYLKCQVFWEECINPKIVRAVEAGEFQIIIADKFISNNYDCLYTIANIYGYYFSASYKSGEFRIHWHG